MSASLIHYFTDPVLRAPVIGCMLMCVASSLVGVIVFLRKESLLGETLSHAAYPGVILGVIAAALTGLTDSNEVEIASMIMLWAFLSAFLGLWIVRVMQIRLRVRSDSALCFVLSCFFGIGVTLASRVQFVYTSLYRQVQVYLFGQAATMTDIHIVIFGSFAALIILTLILFYKELQLIIFDSQYAKSLGVKVPIFEAIIYIFIVLAVVIGIRSVGVVLMSAMLIAPSASARQFTHRLHRMFLLAACFGLVSGFLGVYLSVELSHTFAEQYNLTHFAIPTGPMIVIVISTICVFSLLFAPDRGLVWRMYRVAQFRYQCLCENLLKAFWYVGQEQPINLEKLQQYLGLETFHIKFILFRFEQKGWIKKSSNQEIHLTEIGKKKAANIVRLHRLWEVYLADYLGVGTEKVHRSAEEMEHIITPEIEEQLTILLQNPQKDPHSQPIPPKT